MADQVFDYKFTEEEDQQLTEFVDRLIVGEQPEIPKDVGQELKEMMEVAKALSWIKAPELSREQMEASKDRLMERINREKADR